MPAQIIFSISYIKIQYCQSLALSVMDELEKTKLELQGLRQEFKVLRETHQYTILELAQARENEEKYRKLNDTLIKGLESNRIDLSPLQNINLNIEGSFGCKRCLDLEKQLESYRTGVNVSIERRVKQIAKNFTEFQDQDRKKSRVSCSRVSNQSHHSTFVRQCLNCVKIQKQSAIQKQFIEQAMMQFEQKIADRDIIQAKLQKMEELVHNLQEENAFLQSQLQRLRSLQERSQDSCGYYNDATQRKSRISVNKFSSQNGKSNKMMQEITNLVSCISNRKFQEDKRKSRAFQTGDSSLFSIKDGINRPSLGYF